MSSQLPPVLVVGAGPVGMSAALLLARQGIPCVLIEAKAAVGQHPKARGVRLRTMELLRQWGLADALRDHALPDEAMRFIYCDSLAGEEIGRSAPLEDGSEGVSPSRTCRVAQDSVEVALWDAVHREPLVDLHTNSRLTSVVQSADGVEVDTVSTITGETKTFAGSYLIAADGIGSTVRGMVGIEMEGVTLLGYWQSVYWHGDISRWAGDRPCIQFFTGMRLGKSATIASVDGRERWITMIPQPPSETPPPPVSLEAARQVIKRAVGDDTFEPEILDITTWRLSALVAKAWRAGRVFLAGDAAHSFPPTGGFGMNTGIQDVHNLVWKIALVRSGCASDALLDTYTDERAPIAQANADWSVANSDRIRRIAMAIQSGDAAGLQELLKDQSEHVHAVQQDLGFAYDSSAVLPDGTAALTGDAFVQSARPGRRAPHVWVHSGRTAVSTLDLFEDRFVLLAGPGGGSEWRAQGQDLPDDLPQVDVLCIGSNDGIEVAEDFDRAYDIGSVGAVLVRPDGHVAWRTTSGPAQADELAGVLRRLTS